MPFLTSENGLENLAAHWGKPNPTERCAANFSLKPDLGQYASSLSFLLLSNVGPKMYFASPDFKKEGSTKLHKDVTSAINIMLYAHGKSPTLDKGAEWLVFAREDGPRLCEFLRSEPNSRLDGDSNPCISHQVFIDANKLVQLEKIGIRPFRITQLPGQAVVIPAGCAHQVSIVCLVTNLLMTCCRYPITTRVSRLLLTLSRLTVSVPLRLLQRSFGLRDMRMCFACLHFYGKSGSL